MWPVPSWEKQQVRRVQLQGSESESRGQRVRRKGRETRGVTHILPDWKLRHEQVKLLVMNRR
jgi:hypothetical protein